jgi:hypothetical protein
VRNHVLRLLAVLAASIPTATYGQVKPDSTRRDTALVREIERLMRDSARNAGTPPQQQTPGQASGQSLNPDISAIAELLTDLSAGDAKVTTDGQRFEVREVELGIQAVVDPFFRADFFLGVHPDGAEIEEAFLTALTLPGGVQAKLGQFRVPIGKVNLIHRPEQISIDYPWMIREFFGNEGLSSAGLSMSAIFSPFGFFQELIVYGVGNIGREEHEEDEEVIEIIEAVDEDDFRNQVAFGAQLRNYWDLSLATNLEAGLSAATGRVRELEPDCEILDPCPPVIPVEFFADQSYLGAYLTLRWRPPQQGLYRSFIWNTEVLLSEGFDGSRFGGFSQAQWQLTRRAFVGGRFDAVQRFLFDPLGLLEPETTWFTAVSGYLTFFPSEFSRFKLGLEQTFGEDPFGDQWRVAVQTTFAIGPHRPHAF